ncbi:MAG TPA: cysteine hydrolase [Stellaceae bacterium]|nr:cysteine hydrolase [Stellaceae bacterium]
MPSHLLLALHYQNEVVHPQGKIRVGIAAESPERALIIAAAKRLIDGARSAGVPVVSVRIAFPTDYREIVANAPIWRRVIAERAMIEGGWGAEFYEQLGPLPGEPVVTHRRNNPFHGSPLEDIVASFRPRRLIAAGISTTYVVESAVRHASDLGYEVVVAADACSSASPDMHDASLRAMALLADITTVDAVLAELAPAGEMPG